MRTETYLSAYERALQEQIRKRTQKDAISYEEAMKLDRQVTKFKGRVVDNIHLCTLLIKLSRPYVEKKYGKDVTATTIMPHIVNLLKQEGRE